MISLLELLKSRGLDVTVTSEIMLVRHKDNRYHYDVTDIYQKGHLNTYQSYQNGPIFKKCKFIVSFLGFESSLARFIGVYRVNGHKPSSEVPLPDDFHFLYPLYMTDKDYYVLEEVPGFEDLKDRVVIEWGKATRKWYQSCREKEVIEILPEGSIEVFTDYLEILITYDKLKELIKHPRPNKEWHKLLSAVAGVYLIVDSKTGSQYVGSASGENGILGRWSEYVDNPDGGNTKLKDLILDKENYASNFRFSILQTLPKTLTKAEVIKHEEHYKKKLGSKAFGLNS